MEATLRELQEEFKRHVETEVPPSNNDETIIISSNNTCNIDPTPVCVSIDFKLGYELHPTTHTDICAERTNDATGDVHSIHQNSNDPDVLDFSHRIKTISRRVKTLNELFKAQQGYRCSCVYKCML